MRNYTKIYLDAFRFDETDFIQCEICQDRAVDIHHIAARGMGGDPTGKRDVPENLMALCRKCHDEFGDKKQFKSFLNNKHSIIMKKVGLLILLCISLFASGQEKTFQKFYGGVGFPWTNAYKTFGVHRLYMYTNWFYLDNGKLAIEPNKKRFPPDEQYVSFPNDFDGFLGHIKGEGGTVILCVYNNLYDESKKIPVDDPNGDWSDPDNYDTYSDIIKWLTVFYGSNPDLSNFDHNYVQLEEYPISWAKPPHSESEKYRQEPKAGLNLIDVIQIHNEPTGGLRKSGDGNKVFSQLRHNGWMPGHSGQTPKEHAAMLLAVTRKAWAIDSSMGISVGCPHDWEPEYMDAIKAEYIAMGGLWKHFNPADNSGIIFSFNWYDFHRNAYGQSIEANYPGEDNVDGYSMDDLIAEVTAWCEKNQDYIWISEYGYDTEGNSDLLAPLQPQHNGNRELAQADALIAGSSKLFECPWLLFLTSYEWADQPWSPNSRFGHCGLYGEKRFGFPEKDGTQKVIDHYNTYSKTIPYPVYGEVSDTVYVPPISDTLTTQDTVYITVYDTVRLIIQDIDTVYVTGTLDFDFVGGRYRVFKNGSQVGTYHNKYSKAVQKAYGVKGSDPDSDVLIKQDPIEVR